MATPTLTRWTRVLGLTLAAVVLASSQAGAVAPPPPQTPLEPRELTRMGGVVYFIGCSGVGGCELWRTDGTNRGTRMVYDFGPGIHRMGPRQLVATHDRLFLLASDWAHGEEVWTSDGTTAGTHMVKAILPGKTTMFPDPGIEGRLLLPVGDRVFFGVDDGLHGWEPWVTDGTAAGTHLIKEVDHRHGFSPDLWTRVGRRAFFVSGRRLFVTDGTARGTRLVRTSWSWSYNRPDRLAGMDGRLYVGGGRYLWATDGTPEGTTIVKEFSPGGESDVGNLTVIAHRLWFRAISPGTGIEPWVSDGTPQGTHPVREIARGEHGGEQFEFVKLGDRVIFTDGGGLWRSDGTEAGTRRIPIPALVGTAYKSDLVRYRGSVLFVARRYRAFRPDHLWRTDGTAAGTQRITRVWPASAVWRYDLTPVDGHLVFIADLPHVGQELWRTDGTAAGTQVILPH